MRILGKVVVGVALASLIALPGAQARPRLGGLLLAPLAIVGGIAGAAIGSRKARAHRAYQVRQKARRDRAATIRAARSPSPRPEVAALTPSTGQEQSRAAPDGWAGPLFWPHAYDGVFEYAFGLPGDDRQFWSRGFGDVIDGMFAPPVRETTGSAGARSWENLCGSEAPKAADATVERIRQTVNPNEEQQAALVELRGALARAIERIEGACPSQRAATPPERLHMMSARLAAMRSAVVAVQGPMRNFYEKLSLEQKRALEQTDAGEEGADKRAGANCAAPVANWPQAQIERVLQPTQAQRAILEQLRQTSLGLAQFVASTCPAQMPATAPARLEAIKDRLNVLRYAASNISPVYEQFYASLSDAQKSRFQSMARERRAETRR